MTYKFIIASAVIGISMASCSNEELDSLSTSSQNAIGFNVITNAASRATIIDQNNLTNYDFNVVAYTHNDNAGNRAEFMGDNSEKGGITIKHDGSKWTYKNTSDVRYWPNEALDFYAVSPATAPASSNTYSWTIGKETQTISYSCVDEYDTVEDKANVDVMYATVFNQNSGKVQFTFKHILSQVAFQAKVEYASMEVDINQIQLANAYKSGTFSITSNAWDFNDNSTMYAYNGNNVTVKTTATATQISNTTPMLVIPQQLAKWNTTNPISSATGSYLCIMCKIRQNGVYVHGSADDYAALYVPFEANWEGGKRYIYTIIFGGGYNSNGNAILKPIEFEAVQTDWVDAEGNYDINY